jgi:hypothetical protein
LIFTNLIFIRLKNIKSFFKSKIFFFIVKLYVGDQFTHQKN